MSAGKIFASVFWNTRGILFFNYLEKGKTINSVYYMTLSMRLKEEIAKKTAPNAKEKNAASLR